MQNIIIAIVLGIIGVLVLTWFLKREREETWKQWAISHGFTYQGPPEGPRIIGSADQRNVEVATASLGSDTEAGVEIVQMTVELEGTENLRAEGVRGVIGDLAKLGQECIKTGDETFDRDVIIQAESVSQANEYWTDNRKATFLELVNDTSFETVTLDGTKLAIEYRSVIPDAQQLELGLNQLLAAAKQLDVSSSSDRQTA